MLRIGMLTSGGDCQALNAALRGVAKTLYAQHKGDVEIYGFLDGYRVLVQALALLNRRSAAKELPDFSELVKSGKVASDCRLGRLELSRELSDGYGVALADNFLDKLIPFFVEQS